MGTSSTKEAQLVELKEQFINIAGEDYLINQQEFQQALGIKDDYFARKLFSLFDEDGNGTVESDEFFDHVEMLVNGTQEEKLRFAFRLHDVDGNGTIDEQELRQIIKGGLVENKLDFSPEQVDSLAMALFNKADEDNSGVIDFDEFKQVVSKYPNLADSMTVSPLSWLKPRQREPQAEQKQTVSRHFSLKRYLSNNFVKLLFLVGYVLVNVALFINAVQTYAAAGANVYVQIARGGGAMLNFNGALILIPMMRNLLTWLRQTPLNNYIPIDESVEFHKLVGQVMFGAAIVHTVAHFLNYTTLTNPFLQSLFATKAGLSGFLLLVIFTIMWVTAQDKIRKGGYFKLFYLAHLGYVLWLILMLIHGPRFWKWGLVPIAGFAIERVMRFLSTKEPAYAINGYLLPAKVLGLVVERPANFNYQPGDYLFLKCPEVSNYEWHPFTISSAPEDKKHLTLHIRAVGSWTGAIYDLFHTHHNELQKANDNQNKQIRIPVYLDGPYGTPSTHIYQSSIAVLIGAGIGVTPFASILKSILHRKQAGTLEGLKKVHFFWINRGQRSFEWFLDLLSKIEAEDTDNFFDINIYMTGTQKKSDMKSSTLFIAMDLLHEKTQVDLITGLKTQTKTGRPDWNTIFQEIRAEHKGQKVDVYFCGSPGLSRVLKKECDKFEFNYRKENF